jgi:hypothetical protein
MSKEKRTDFALFTIAVSILLSSVIIANQANGATAYVTKKEFLAYKQCSNSAWKVLQDELNKQIMANEYLQIASMEILKKLNTIKIC